MYFCPTFAAGPQKREHKPGKKHSNSRNTGSLEHLDSSSSLSPAVRWRDQDGILRQSTPSVKNPANAPLLELQAEGSGVWSDETVQSPQHHLQKHADSQVATSSRTPQRRRMSSRSRRRKGNESVINGSNSTSSATLQSVNRTLRELKSLSKSVESNRKAGTIPRTAAPEAAFSNETESLVRLLRYREQVEGELKAERHGLTELNARNRSDLEADMRAINIAIASAGSGESSSSARVKKASTAPFRVHHRSDGVEKTKSRAVTANNGLALSWERWASNRLKGLNRDYFPLARSCTSSVPGTTEQQPTASDQQQTKEEVLSKCAQRHAMRLLRDAMRKWTTATARLLYTRRCLRSLHKNLINAAYYTVAKVVALPCTLCFMHGQALRRWKGRTNERRISFGAAIVSRLWRRKARWKISRCFEN